MKADAQNRKHVAEVRAMPEREQLALMREAIGRCLRAMRRWTCDRCGKRLRTAIDDVRVTCGSAECLRKMHLYNGRYAGQCAAVAHARRA